MANKFNWSETVLRDSKKKFEEIMWAYNAYKDSTNEFVKDDFKWYTKMLFENGHVYVSQEALKLITDYNDGRFTPDDISAIQEGKIPDSYLQKKTHGSKKLNQNQESLVWEHVVPTDLIIDLFLETPTEENYCSLMENYGMVCIVTGSEDVKLTKAGLRSKMPNDIELSPSSRWDRYKAVGIKVISE